MNTKYIIHRENENFVIYDARFEERKNQIGVLKKFGFLCLALSFCGFILFLSPILSAEIKYRLNQTSSQPGSTISGFGQILWLDKKGIISPADWNFSLIIPTIGINTKVENSVDPNNDKEYEIALKSGVAHAKGTSFPNQSGTVFIFGHSTDYPWNISRYNAYFYPLKYLKEGEEVIIVYKGKTFLYQIVEKNVVEASDLESLVSKDGEKRLVLQTCWPPGTTWKRLVVVASPKEET